MLTLVELAQRLGVHPSTLRHQVRNGRLAATKIGPLWVVDDAEATRYETQIRGKFGPKAPR